MHGASYSDFNLLLWFRASRKKNMNNYALYIFFEGVGCFSGLTLRRFLSFNFLGDAKLLYSHRLSVSAATSVDIGNTIRNRLSWNGTPLELFHSTLLQAIPLLKKLLSTKLKEAKHLITRLPRILLLKSGKETINESGNDTSLMRCWRVSSDLIISLSCIKLISHHAFNYVGYARSCFCVFALSAIRLVDNNFIIYGRQQRSCDTLRIRMMIR